MSPLIIKLKSIIEKQNAQRHEGNLQFGIMTPMVIHTWWGGPHSETYDN